MSPTSGARYPYCYFRSGRFNSKTEMYYIRIQLDIYFAFEMSRIRPDKPHAFSVRLFTPNGTPMSTWIPAEEIATITLSPAFIYPADGVIKIGLFLKPLRFLDRIRRRFGLLRYRILIQGTKVCV